MKFWNIFAASFSGILISCLIPSMAQGGPADPFMGIWALQLDYENNNAGWLEVRQGEGYLDASILWRWGSVYPVDFTFVEQGELFLTHGEDVVWERDENGNPLRTGHTVYWFDVKKEGPDQITGEAVFPNRDGIGVESVKFTGKRIPSPGKAPKTSKAKYGAPERLFNGRDLEGWELVDPNTTSGWKVVDGILVNDPVQKEGAAHINYGNLRTRATYEDFNLIIEVNVPEGSNSGIYLRGIYEVQVMDSYGKKPDPHNMGALYSRITPSASAEKPAGEWQSFDITLYQRHLTVSLNGVTIIDNQPVMGVTGGALTSDEFIPGPIYLQGDHGKVSFRNMVITPILQ
jgi:hypothetical protein